MTSRRPICLVSCAASGLHVLLLLTAMAACTPTRRGPGHPGAATTGPGAGINPPTPDAGLLSGEYLGTVHVIGNRGRFVLVETPLAQAVPSLADGQALVCRSAGVAGAALRVSHERRAPFVVADVIAGEPHVGDEVFIDNAPAHTAAAPTAGSSLFPLSASPTPAPTPEFRANPSLPPMRP